MRLLFLVALLLTFGGAGVDAAGPGREHRIALVIGNSAYQFVGSLRNTVNDARAIARSLRGLGFDVVEAEDLRQKDLQRAIVSFGQRIREAGPSVTLFYYAGHGVQAKGQNFLVPIDAKLLDESEIRIEGVPIDLVTEQMNDAANSVNIIVLDACRNNPFEGRGRGMTRGLAAVDAASGTLIAYATAPGAIADDGSGEHGLYTEELLNAVKEPGVPVEDVFKHVRSRVYARSKGTQTPWESSSLIGDFVFNPAPSPPQATAMRLPPSEPGVVQGQSAGMTFRDCSDCPIMVALPAGQFVMGSDRRDDESPAHPVLLRAPLAVGKFLVTRGEFSRFVDATRYVTGDGCYVRNGVGQGNLDGSKSWRDPGFPQTDHDPVVCVSWTDAQAYAAWLARTTRKTYRLLSEAEWEYAARAGSTTERWWGDGIGSGNANCSGCGSPWDAKGTSPVESFPANPFGLNDMLGNTWQWVADCWQKGYGGAPNDASVVLTSGDCSRRIARGGSWADFSWNVRAGIRVQSAAGNRDSNFGFRVARAM